LPTDKDHHITGLLDVLYPLTAGNVCVLRAGQKCWDEDWCSRDQLRSQTRALQYVVFENIGDDVLVIIFESLVEGRVRNLVEGLVIRRKYLANVNSQIHEAIEGHEGQNVQ
jgi:hypothetical protein